MVVFGAASLLLAAVKNYNATALSLLRAGAVRSHSARWGNVLDELRELGGEKKGYIITHHAQWPLIVPGGGCSIYRSLFCRNVPSHIYIEANLS